MKFHSQIGQDRFLLEHFFRGRRGGVFVDIGAYDGEMFSNTLFFERSMGWTGLCVEPLPSAFAKLAATRRSICEIFASEVMKARRILSRPTIAVARTRKCPAVSLRGVYSWMSCRSSAALCIKHRNGEFRPGSKSNRISREPLTSPSETGG